MVLKYLGIRWFDGTEEKITQNYTKAVNIEKRMFVVLLQSVLVSLGQVGVLVRQLSVTNMETWCRQH